MSRPAAEGPRIVFFSGGTALRGLSRALLRHTWNTVHLVTPFDSGGSSAALREAFGIIAVGDLRNRLLALADQSRPGFMAVAALLGRRLPKQQDPARLSATLEYIASGESPEFPHLPAPVAEAAQADMSSFLAGCPQSFDAAGASVGNLLLVGAWLRHRRNLDRALSRWSALLGVRGVVRPVVESDLHLAFQLTDGSQVVGQHRVTGKAAPVPPSRIATVGLVRTLDDPAPARVVVSDEVGRLIRDADLICYPMGSFYTSILANLLPAGVGAAIAEARCSKVFVANTGPDPEQRGLSVAAAAARLIEVAQDGLGPGARVMDAVVVDAEQGSYPDGVDQPALSALGLRVLDMPLVTRASKPHLDPQRLASLLVRLAGVPRGASDAP